MTGVGFKFDNTYLQLPEVFYTKILPAPVPKPELVILNTPLATELGLDFSDTSLDKQAELFSKPNAGNSRAFAQAYAGHQFGHFTMLGDGRAIAWGEHIHRLINALTFSSVAQVPRLLEGEMGVRR